MKNKCLAIIGIGCRFPGGVKSTRHFWEFLKNGKEAIVDIPSDRWNLKKYYNSDVKIPAKLYAKQGGFLKENIFEFDPTFFGISPKEADSVDPQQRILLELTWEAFEDAGIPLSPLKGKEVGVFIGGFTLDHTVLQFFYNYPKNLYLT